MGQILMEREIQLTQERALLAFFLNLKIGVVYPQIWYIMKPIKKY